MAQRRHHQRYPPRHTISPHRPNASYSRARSISPDPAPQPSSNHQRRSPSIIPEEKRDPSQAYWPKFPESSTRQQEEPVHQPSPSPEAATTIISLPDDQSSDSEQQTAAHQEEENANFIPDTQLIE